jgi:hypothetical protein
MDVSRRWREWYLYLPPTQECPLQPYRSAPTIWSVSSQELDRIECSVKTGDASALNSLGPLTHVTGL